MTSSPYHTTVYPPIRDLEEYEKDLLREQLAGEDGSIIAGHHMIELGQDLVEQCKFLERKLSIKVRINCLDRTCSKTSADEYNTNFYPEIRYCRSYQET